MSLGIVIGIEKVITLLGDITVVTEEHLELVTAGNPFATKAHVGMGIVCLMLRDGLVIIHQYGSPFGYFITT